MAVSRSTVVAVVATLAVAITAGAGAHAKPLQCDDLTGWRRIVELYSGHWDAVSLLVFDDEQGNGKQVQAAALCGGPLVLNQWGMSSGPMCDGGWYTPSEGCQHGSYSGDGSTVPLWGRLGHGRKTRIERLGDVVPRVEVEGLEAFHNLHDHPDLRPADLAIYVVDDTTDTDEVWDHVSAQADETLHAIMIKGPVCGKNSKARSLGFKIVADHGKWELEHMYCGEDDVSGDDGLMVLRRNSQIGAMGGLFSMTDTIGAPVHLSGDEVYTTSLNLVNTIYAIPEVCLYRYARNPLQKIVIVDDEVQSHPHTGVLSKYQNKGSFMSVAVKPAGGFRGKYFSGHYCGITVFSTAFSIQKSLLFYTIAIPIVEAFHFYGFPSFLRYETTSKLPRTPVLHTYFHYEMPRAEYRERRYIAYQLEYSPAKIRDKRNIKYMSNAVVPWEYTQAQLDHFRDSGVANVTQMPLCYHPTIEFRLPETPKPVSNGLFPGIISGKRRREEILQDLNDAGLKILFRSYLKRSGTSMGPLYGVDDVLDGQKAEVVLNFHAYGDNGDAQLEVPRLTPYLSNGLFVISERGKEPEQEALLENALVFVPKDEPRLTSELVKKYTGDEHKEVRARIGAEAKKTMKKHFRCEKTENFKNSVKAAIDAAFPQWLVSSFYDEASSTLEV